jgi:phosphate butyryltransferase
MKITRFEDLAAEAAAMTRKTKVAVVEAQDEHTLESVVRAAGDGLILPSLIGDPEQIVALLGRLGAGASGFDIIASSGAEESLAKAVGLVRSGRAAAIMKGRLDTAQLMRAILNKENRLVPAGGKLSLMGFYETPKYHKVFAVSDFGINTYPDLEGKKIIVQNAVRFMHAVGCACPKVAVLSSVEKLNPRMPDAVDGDALKRMNQSGELAGCIVEGPISFDLAMSLDSARIKGYESPVAGDADLLIVPDIAAGNILVKSLTMFGGARTAGIVVGAKVPVILTSRSAEASDKYYSIALAACAAAPH